MSTPKQIVFSLNPSELKLAKLNPSAFSEAMIGAAVQAVAFEARIEVKMAEKVIGYAEVSGGTTPAVKKEAHAGSPATRPALNKDGSPRKKSGPAPGFKRGQHKTTLAGVMSAQVPVANTGKDPDPRPHSGPSTPAPGTVEAEKLEQAPRTQNPVSQPETTASEDEAATPEAEQSPQ